MKILILTNGASAAHAIRDAGIEGRILPWEDVLHEGPVPGGVNHESLSEIRARFIASRRWATVTDARRRFRERDRVFPESAGGFDEIVCWFEHDLYDQLQLIQILALDPPDATLICHDRFIAMSTGDKLRQDWAERVPVSRKMRDDAASAWAAFRRADPNAVADLVSSRHDLGLPFLRDALYRWLEEFPDRKSGLTRTEWQILWQLKDDEKDAGCLFRDVSAREEAPFLGDASFWVIVARLCWGPEPLVSSLSEFPFDPIHPAGTQFRLTGKGEDAVAGNVSMPKIRMDCWMGGVHLRPDNLWYFDTESNKMITGGYDH